MKSLRIGKRGQIAYAVENEWGTPVFPTIAHARNAIARLHLIEDEFIRWKAKQNILRKYPGLMPPIERAMLIMGVDDGDEGSD
jgi:hypothetical protein